MSQDFLAVLNASDMASLEKKSSILTSVNPLTPVPPVTARDAPWPARRVKLWSLNSNLFFKEPHQLTKFT